MSREIWALQNMINCFEECEMTNSSTTSAQSQMHSGRFPLPTWCNNGQAVACQVQAVTNFVPVVRNRLGQTSNEQQSLAGAVITPIYAGIQLPPRPSTTSLNSGQAGNLSNQTLKKMGGMTESEKNQLWVESELLPTNETLQKLMSMGDPMEGFENSDSPVYNLSVLGSVIKLPTQQQLAQLHAEAKTRREKELTSAKLYQTNLFEKLRDTNPAGIILLSGVIPLTLRRYHSRVFQVVKAGYPVSLYGLAGFLSTHNRTFAHLSLDAWGCSINLFSCFLGRKTTDSERDYWNRFKKGMKNCTPEGVAKVKGAITRPLVDQMLNWGSQTVGKGKNTHQRYPQNLLDGLMLQHAAGLRTSEVELVRFSNTVYDEARGCYCVSFRKQKDPKASERNEILMEYHHTDSHRNAEIKALLDAIKDNVNDAPLIEEWDAVRANEIVKAASKHFKWDPNLFWSDHGLRHGSAVDAAQDANDRLGAKATEKAIDDAVFDRTGHLSESMRRMYSEDSKRRRAKGLVYKRLKFLLNSESTVLAANKAMELRWGRMVKEGSAFRDEEFREEVEEELRDAIHAGTLDMTNEQKALQRAKPQRKLLEDEEEADETETKTPKKGKAAKAKKTIETKSAKRGNKKQKAKAEKKTAAGKKKAK